MTQDKFFTTLRYHHPWVFYGIVLAFGAVLFFVIRLVVFSIYWMDPDHRFQPLQPWMTPGYIARSYDIPRDEILTVLMGDQANTAKKTLDHIAKDRGQDVDIVIQDLTLWLIQRSGARHD